jgi:hypothetical protein
MTQAASVTAALLIIGDEILSGRTKDENIGYVADYLTKIGIDLREARVVPDAAAHPLGSTRPPPSDAAKLQHPQARPCSVWCMISPKKGFRHRKITCYFHRTNMRYLHADLHLLASVNMKLYTLRGQNLGVRSPEAKGVAVNSCAILARGQVLTYWLLSVFSLEGSAQGARSSAGEHYVDIVGVTGSIPVAPTIIRY